MKVLILAGGYGTRLYPLIKDTPKALLELNGKPLIDYTMDKVLPIEGLEEVVVVTNDKFYGHLLEWAESFKDGSVPIRVINDGTKTPEDRLGSIGDIQFVLEQEKQVVDWLVIGSDNIFDYSLDAYVSFSQKNSPNVSIGLYDLQGEDDASKYGVVDIDEDAKVLSFEEKPEVPKSTLITMCLYYFPAETLAYVKQFLEEDNSSDAAGGYIQWLYQKKYVYGFKFTGKWYDIGTIDSYNEAKEFFLKNN